MGEDPKAPHEPEGPYDAGPYALGPPPKQGPHRCFLAEAWSRAGLGR